MAHSTASEGDTPQVSVVMPVHNALPYLDEAVESILGQTFRDFEFVILDDGSTDGSSERLEQWARRDERIRLIRSPAKLGPVASSQRVADEARAPLVARMDADDLSCPDRLAEQCAVLRRRPDVAVVGCLSDLIDASGRQVREADLWRLSRRSRAVPFAHGAMMYRRELFDQVGGYRRQCELWEDQDLITRMAELGRVAVIPRLLCRIRQTPTSTRGVVDLLRQETALDRMYRASECTGNPEGAPATAGNGTVDPRVFISLGSVILWSGGRPGLFRRLLARGRLRPDLRSAGALAWTSWASASPRTLRGFLRLLLTLRNAVAARAIGGDELVYWRPPGPRSRETA